GIVQGLAIGIMIFGMMVLASLISTGSFQGERVVMTALVTSFSICIALIVSTLLGALIPLAMEKVHIDPAVASGPFITTISDIITLSLYYSISLAILLPLYV
ncbi:MAG: magnesium transporter, partial [Candidatus Izemoplasmatales bacterium]|nr:magnesium transporter [Candidatus Izemoplasmatales bacterium]